MEPPCAPTIFLEEEGRERERKKKGRRKERMRRKNELLLNSLAGSTTVGNHLMRLCNGEVRKEILHPRKCPVTIQANYM